MNERKTEDIVEKWLRKEGYREEGCPYTVEKQSSDAPRVKKLLETASKNGPGVGKPEFLIRSSKQPGFIIVIECKASTLKHASPSLSKYADYAVDGALLYASYLSKDFDVLAIGISGEKESQTRVSHYIHLRGTSKAVEYTGASGILPFDDYYDGVMKSDVKFRQDYGVLLDYSRSLNHQLQSKKVTEAERGFLISGVLIALENTVFKNSYKTQRKPSRLADSLLTAINQEFEDANLPADRRDMLAQSFSFIPQCPAIQDIDFALTFIAGIDETVNTFMRTHSFYDVIGQFYVEFLRYANNDKGLGIVLTPHHIAELFAELAGVDKNSVVFDNCCGTAGLLIGAMRVMIRDAGDSKSVQKRIKDKQLFGIEFQPKVYALAVSNMILHGDGRTNIYRGDCLEEAEVLMKGQKPNVGILNPP
jgi:hypothetical protein